MKKYEPKKIERKWQTYWRKNKMFAARNKSGKPKEYLLVEFPYPSGEGMHVGHIRSYTAMDVIARKRRMEGYNVLYPMGWDAFGLPTENYAIKIGVQPKVVTKKNTDNFRRQLKSIGFSFDWEREINTTDPNYYKWTQWIFLQFFKHGLAYKAKMPINWCLSCKIGLANEEVVNGRCERCGGPTEKREKEQWMLAITKYADRLDKDLDLVDYLEPIKIQQRNWIGRSEGAEISFKLKFENEPTFHQFFEPGTIKEGEPFVEREIILAVIKHYSEDKYLCLKWKKVAWETFITGGVETGQTTEEAVIAETREETGYKNFKFLKYLGNIHSKFFHPPKKQNRFAHISIFYGELKNGARGAVSDVEQGNHEIVWLTKNQIEKFNLPSSHRYAWELIQNGGMAPTKEVKVFTTRPDTLSGATYLVIAPEHSLVAHCIHQAPNAAEVSAYINKASQETAMERTAERRKKTGVELIGVKAINPLSGEEMPIWVADYVLGDYGTGAIMAVPAHDKRDREFAEIFNLPIIQKPLINANEVVTKVGGKKMVTYKLRDWIFSRQRYWGEPIPMIYCEKCAGSLGKGWNPVPEKDLPVKLPEIKRFKPTDNGESPLARLDKWVNVKCPLCGRKAKRETDTMPNWAGSSWYYLAYIIAKDLKSKLPAHDAKTKKLLAPNLPMEKLLNYWLPVDWYNGGMEHTTLHLLYSRFWHKFLYDIKILPTKEPYAKRTSHGLILAQGGAKMSKSKGNTVSPDEIVKNYGADALRIYEMFMGPFDQSIAWNTAGLMGARRFLERVWRIKSKVKKGKVKSASIKLDYLIHQTVKKVGEDVEEMKFNTAISQLMILLNEMEKEEFVKPADYKILLRLLSLFAPHIAEEIWADLGGKKSIVLASWPNYDKNKLTSEVVTMIVQINGKVRDQFESSPGALEKEIVDISKSRGKVKMWLKNKTIKKIFFVPNKLINMVVSD